MQTQDAFLNLIFVPFRDSTLCILDKYELIRTYSQSFVYHILNVELNIPQKSVSQKQK